MKLRNTCNGNIIDVPMNHAQMLLKQGVFVECMEDQPKPKGRGRPKKREQVGDVSTAN